MIKDFQIKKVELKIKFKQLKTFKEKINFWTKKLEFEYFLYLQYKSSYPDFDFIPPEVFLLDDFKRSTGSYSFL